MKTNTHFFFFFSHFFLEWEMSPTNALYSECVFVALLIQCVRRMRPIISSYGARMSVHYFSTLFHKWHIFEKKLWDIKCKNSYANVLQFYIIPTFPVLLFYENYLLHNLIMIRFLSFQKASHGTQFSY
jgi:hypothetical protein